MLLNKVLCGDCLSIVDTLPDECVDIIVTSPPYWGQRTSNGVGVEDDPRDYLAGQIERFTAFQRILKPEGVMWINIGDAYNTPVNWSQKDYVYSSLGKDRLGFDENNSAYTKPRHKRKAFIDDSQKWLKYGNLLALPQRLTVGLCDTGWYFRGEVIWKKKNPMPEGKCRRPHRSHEGIYLFAKNENHQFAVTPPVKSVWEFPSEAGGAIKHSSRFPKELPRRCIESYGKTGKDVVVLDPYSGSATTGVAAIELGCSYIGIEIETRLAEETNKLFEGMT